MLDPATPYEQEVDIIAPTYKITGVPSTAILNWVAVLIVSRTPCVSVVSGRIVKVIFAGVLESAFALDVNGDSTVAPCWYFGVF